MRFYLKCCLVLLSTLLFAQNEALQQYILTNTKEIEADTRDFKGLSFLDTLLANKRIVFLGESSHGTEEYSRTKLQLIKYLHKKLGFNVVLFESPMTAGTYFNLARDTASAGELIRNSIQNIWHTKTVLQLFDYMKENELSFGGIDPQFIPSKYPDLIYANAFSNYPDIKNDLIGLENRISEAFKNGQNSKRLTDSISNAYAGLLSKLDKISLSPLQEWMKHIVSININYYARLNNGDERDLCMVKNLVWLAENTYPKEKIIVWAHNTHIDKNSLNRSKFMGKILAEHFGPQMYGVGLYMVNGATALNDRTIITVKVPPKNSLEGLLSARGFKTAFIATNDSSFNRQLTTFHWGKTRQDLNLSKSYDAVILINGVSAPEYLK